MFREIIILIQINIVFIGISFSQVVPNFPPEVTLGFFGYTNCIPGCDPNNFSMFSFSKISIQQDLPSTERLANVFNFLGTYERYLDAMLSRDYHPLYLNPILRSYFFANDIFTLGMEINGIVQSVPGTNEKGKISAIYNKKVRFIPYHYLVVHPKLIVQERLGYGVSRNSGKSSYQGNMLSSDYDIMRYEMRLIYLAPYNIKVFMSPFGFSNKYYEIPAASRDGSFNKNNPTLREKGGGLAAGLRYSSFRWGYP